MGRGVRERSVHIAIKRFTEPVSATEVAKLATEIAGQEVTSKATGYYLRQNPYVRCIEIYDGPILQRKYVIKDEVIKC